MDSRDAFNEIAWRDFIMFAWAQPEAHAAFRGATGRAQRSQTGSFLDKLIDDAVGGAEDDRYMTEFIEWVTEKHWGKRFAPKKFRKATSS